MESSDWMTGKTPVTVLNELAAAAKIQTPAFECVGTSDGVFIMRTAVSIYGLSAEGRGRTKQNAKHSAAQALLLLIVANSEVREKLDFLPDVSSEKASELVRALWSGGDGDGGGGVGEEVKKTPIQLLGEFVTKQGWNLAPSYSGESQRENSDGTKTFVVKASLGKFSAEGEGKRIKEAKQAAAKALLHKFEDGQGLLSPFPNSEADEDPDGAYATKDVPGTQDIQVEFHFNPVPPLNSNPIPSYEAVTAPQSTAKIPPPIPPPPPPPPSSPPSPPSPPPPFEPFPISAPSETSSSGSSGMTGPRRFQRDPEAATYRNNNQEYRMECMEMCLRFVLVLAYWLILAAVIIVLTYLSKH